MKIRCTENSVRLRLRKSDLNKLRKEEKIFESVTFPALNKFSFGISIHDDFGGLGAEFDAGLINILLPKTTFKKWFESEALSIEENVLYNKEESIHILIEKDLPCKDRADEDKSDTFEELVDQGRVC